MSFGAPSLLNQVGIATSNIRLVVADALRIFQLFASPTWGIYNADGSLAILPDSVVSVEYRREWVVSNYPKEAGSFQSYNKVQLPFENRVRLSKGGEVFEKQSFLETIEQMAGSLNLYDIVTPERTYYNCNITGIGQVRDATSGAGLMLVDIDLLEIRTSASSIFSNTKSPMSADPVVVGTVQPQSPLPTLTPIT